jgi:hypothetical protein
MGNRLEFRYVPKPEAPARTPSEIDRYRAIEAAKRRHTDALRQARSRYDAELHYALRSPHAHLIADQARAQLERDLAAADKALKDALRQAHSNIIDAEEIVVW